MKNREDIVAGTNRKLEGLNREVEELKEKIGKTGKECAKNENELRKVSEELDVLVGKNKEQTKKVKQGESTLRDIENDLDQE